MEEKLEVVEINEPKSILGAYGDAVIDIIKSVVEKDKLVGILSIDEEPVSDENMVVSDDLSNEFEEDFDVLKVGVLNENKGVFVKHKNGFKAFFVQSETLDNCKLYEYNSRIIDFYNINGIIINSLVHNVFENKIKTQSISNNIAYADIVIKRLKARGNHKAYVAVRNLLYDLFLNPSKKYSLESISSKSSVFTNAHREYLSGVIEKIKNNPRDLSFFVESDLDF